VRRRSFITLLGGAAAWPLLARAQQRGGVWRVGLLAPAASAFFENVTFKLRDLGYVEGRNLILDTRHAEGDFSRLPALAAELVALRPDAIVALATPAVLAAQQATSSIPIVMAPATDPIASGFVQSLARPGGNITGVSHIATDLTTKMLELLKTLVPSVRRVAILTSTNPVHALQVTHAYAAAPELGLTVFEANAVLPSDVDAAFSLMRKQGCDGLVVLADARIIPQIPDLAQQARVPAIYQVGFFVRRMGGLMSYGPDYRALHHLAAVFVDKIFKGAQPSTLPVEQPAKFELLINLKAAKALDLEIPPQLLARADEVIE
jgi:putative ABC transport system substrate-binding protein